MDTPYSIFNYYVKKFLNWLKTSCAAEFP